MPSGQQTQVNWKLKCCHFSKEPSLQTLTFGFQWFSSLQFKWKWLRRVIWNGLQRWSWPWLNRYLQGLLSAPTRSWFAIFSARDALRRRNNCLRTAILCRSLPVNETLCRTLMSVTIQLRLRITIAIKYWLMLWLWYLAINIFSFHARKKITWKILRQNEHGSQKIPCSTTKNTS